MSNLFNSYSSLSTLTDITVLPVVDGITGQNRKITAADIRDYIGLRAGATGATGLQGASGTIGIDGTTGATGPTGAPGTSVTILGATGIGSELPPSYSGSIGDGYLTLDGHLWVWNGANWTDVGNIQGPIGATGANGVDGATGANGVDGATGATGATGPAGPIIPASTTTLGAVIVGHNLSIDSTGTLVSLGSVIGDFPPVDNPQEGDHWWDSNVGRGFIYYSGTWVEYSPNSSGGSVDLSAVAQHIIPATDLTYDLGSTSSQWHSLYVGTGTIYIGGVALGLDPERNITINGAPIVTVNTTGELTIAGSTSTVIGSNIIVSDTAPLNATTGTLWYDEVAGRTYIYWNTNWIDANPAEVGPQGIQGIQGIQGPAGADSTVPGPQGPAGTAATITVGTVTASSTITSVTNVGTSQDAVFDFVLPQGPQGIKGDPGDFIAGLGDLIVPSTSDSISTNTGALQVAGGAGFGGSLYIGNNSGINFSDTLNISANGLIEAPNRDLSLTAGGSFGSGRAYIELVNNSGINIYGGDTGVSGNITLDGGATGNVIITKSTISTSTTTGALVVAGGVGIGGSVHISGTLTLYSTTLALGIDSQATGQAIAIGCYSAATGRGASIGMASQAIDDSVALGPYTQARNNGISIGFGANLNNGSAVSAIVINATGVEVQSIGSNPGLFIAPIRPDAATSATTYGVYYNPVTKELTTATAATGGGLASPYSGIFTITNTATSISTTTGALQVAGGVGVGGTVWAEQLRQTSDVVSIGKGAGGSPGTGTVAIGENAGQTLQGFGGGGSVAIGQMAGQNTQGANAVAVGVGSAITNQGTGAVAVGQSAGEDTQGINAVAIGLAAGGITQGISAVAIGYSAGESSQGTSAVAIGDSAGLNNQSDYAVAIGADAGNATQGAAAVAIGPFAGQTTQGADAVAIGHFAGYTNQGADAVAIGRYAGWTTQGLNAVAIGLNAGNQYQGEYAVAVGLGAGQGLVVTANYVSGATSNSYLVVDTTVDIVANMFVTGTGFATNRRVISVIDETTVLLTGVADSTPSGVLTFTGSQTFGAVAVGAGAGYNAQGESATAVGNNAGSIGQKGSAVAVGAGAGSEFQGFGAVAVGTDAGGGQQGDFSVAVGYGAGAQGANSIAIGPQAGYYGQTTGSIIISAGRFLNDGNLVSEVTTVTNAGLYIAPIRADATTSATTYGIYYNPVTKELTTSTVASNKVSSTVNSLQPQVQMDDVRAGINLSGQAYIGSVADSHGCSWCMQAQVYNTSTFTYVVTNDGGNNVPLSTTADQLMGPSFGRQGDLVFGTFTDGFGGHVYKITWVCGGAGIDYGTVIIERLA